tara:strand:+ start:601 stop:2742 length:2142 start_codon:yes stop_codon:yes gene_type:complete
MDQKDLGKGRGFISKKELDAIKAYNEQQTKKEESQKREIANLKAMEEAHQRTGKEVFRVTDAMKKRLEFLEREEFVTNKIADLERKYADASNSGNRVKAERNKLAGKANAAIKKALKDEKLTVAEAKKLTALNEEIAAGRLTIKEIDEAIKENANIMPKSMGKILGAQKSITAQEKFANDARAKGKELIGQMGSAIGFSVTNPLAMAVGMMTIFTASSKALGKEFGAIGTGKMRDDLMGSVKEFNKLGIEGFSALTTIKSISSNFGIALSDAKELTNSAGELSIALGISVEDSATLLGTLTAMTEMSKQQSEELLKQVTALSEMNGVAPSDVLGDVAKNTEFFAKFAKQGGENVFRAAIQAKKLGMNLATVSKVSEGIMSFQNSLNKEIEASILLGRQVNLQKAREAALMGDTEGLQREIVNLVGSQAEFEAMLPFQRQALADALNMEVKDLSKIVNKEKEQVTLAGELSRMSTENLVSDEVITNTAKLLNNLKNLGLEMGEKLGPTFDAFLKPLAGFVGFLAETNLLMPLMIGYMVGSAAKTVIMTNAMYAQAQAAITLAAAQTGEVGAGLAAGGAKMFASYSWMGPFAIPLVLGALATIGTAVYGYMSGLETGTELGGIKADNVVTPLHKGETVLNKQDTAMLAASLSAVRGTGGGTNNTTIVDTSKLEKGNEQVGQKLDQLVSVMNSAFGFGGTVAADIGASVSSNLQKA